MVETSSLKKHMTNGKEIQIDKEHPESIIAQINTLSPTIVEEENYPTWTETTIGGTQFSLPWLWEEVYPFPWEESPWVVNHPPDLDGVVPLCQEWRKRRARRLPNVLVPWWIPEDHDVILVWFDYFNQNYLDEKNKQIFKCRKCHLVRYIYLFPHFCLIETTRCKAFFKGTTYQAPSNFICFVVKLRRGQCKWGPKCLLAKVWNKMMATDLSAGFEFMDVCCWQGGFYGWSTYPPQCIQGLLKALLLKAFESSVSLNKAYSTGLTSWLTVEISVPWHSWW